MTLTILVTLFISEMMDTRGDPVSLVNAVALGSLGIDIICHLFSVGSPIMNKYKVLSVDPEWYYNRWQWGNTYNIGFVTLDPNWSSREILKVLRHSGFLSEHSKGNVRVEIFDDSCIEVQSKNTRKPIIGLILEV